MARPLYSSRDIYTVYYGGYKTILWKGMIFMETIIAILVVVVLVEAIRLLRHFRKHH